MLRAGQNGCIEKVSPQILILVRDMVRGGSRSRTATSGPLFRKGILSKRDRLNPKRKRKVKGGRPLKADNPERTSANGHSRRVRIAPLTTS